MATRALHIIAPNLCYTSQPSGLQKAVYYPELCMCEHVVATYNICYIVLVQLKV